MIEETKDWKVLLKRPAKVIYRDRDKVIKVFDHNFSVADVLNESLNQARVQETDLRIPELLEVGKTREGKWAICMEYVEGQTLAQAIEEAKSKSPDKAQELLGLFVDIQLKMFKKSTRLLNSLREKTIRQIGEAALDPVVRYDLHTRAESMPRESHLCHGDFNPSNIILTPDGQDCIIDWSHATQGEPAADVARTYLLFKLAKQDDEAEKYLDLIGQKGELRRSDIQRWLPLVAACQTLKGNQTERDFLMKWVNVVDFE
ncbi:MAG: phosphotransferase [Deltaproteobacteria bacterium]|nr:phosphotransferase [Deltaproteobacteria bacterium]